MFSTKKTHLGQSGPNLQTWTRTGANRRKFYFLLFCLLFVKQFALYSMGFGQTIGSVRSLDLMASLATVLTTTAVSAFHCCVCCEPFGPDADVHCPRILRCGHTFCTRCLFGLATRPRLSRICPLCRARIKIPEGGVANLAKNYTLLQAVEEAQLTAASVITTDSVTPPATDTGSPSAIASSDDPSRDLYSSPPRLAIKETSNTAVVSSDDAKHHAHDHNHAGDIDKERESVDSLSAPMSTLSVGSQLKGSKAVSLASRACSSLLGVRVRMASASSSACASCHESRELLEETEEREALRDCFPLLKVAPPALVSRHAALVRSCDDYDNVTHLYYHQGKCYLFECSKQRGIPLFGKDRAFIRVWILRSEGD